MQIYRERRKQAEAHAGWLNVLLRPEACLPGYADLWGRGPTPSRVLAVLEPGPP